MLTVNSDRQWNRLMELAAIGATPKGGVCRVALTDEDRKGRDRYIEWCKKAGCAIEIDQMGNIFARRAGKVDTLPPILIGSHLDSQPTGGKFDGAYGVLAGLELIETLNDHQVETNHPIEVVSWTNEEGARFAPAMISSGVFAGVFTLTEAYNCTDKEGIRLGDELERIGYKGSVPVGNRPYKATFEIHIEQGPILEQAGHTVGVVTGVQGIRWYDLVLYGKETHAGPTPMNWRVDPVRVATAILQGMYKLADTYGPNARLTVGYLDANPGVKNTVPGSLKVSIDMRHPNERTLTAMHNDLRFMIREHLQSSKVNGDLQEIWYAPPVHFDEQCIGAVRRAVEKLGVSAKEMVSGAGHDAAYVSMVAPTSMIFIPCKDGLSHNELESIEPEHAAMGTNVLLHAVLEMDQKLDAEP